MPQMWLDTSPKKGHRSSQQNYLCKNCGRQFVESYSQRDYSDDVKQICLRMYYNGLGFREIERLTGISHNTIINWVRQAEFSPNDSEVHEMKEDTKPDEIRESFKSPPCYQRAVFV